MRKLPYTIIQKILSGMSLLILVFSYLYGAFWKTAKQDAVFLLFLATILFLITALFEFYPQTTNLVTSKKYNQSSEDLKKQTEHRTRNFICTFRLLLMILFLITLL